MSVAAASWTDIREVLPVHRLSVIVPFVGDLRRLEDTLVSVLQHRPGGVELIVPHSVPYGDPYHLAGEVRFVAAPKRATAAECAALGIAASNAPLVHLLGCGVEVSDGWTDAALAHFERPDVAAVAPLLADKDHPECVLATGLSYLGNGRETVLGAGSTRFTLTEDAARVMGPTMRAAFYRKAAIDALPGGLDASLGDVLAAVDVAATLKRVGWNTVFESRSVVYDEPFDAAASKGMRGAFYRGLQEERLFRRQLAGRLTRAMRVSHGMSVLSNLLVESPFRSVARVLGHMCAAVESAEYDRFHDRLIHVERAVAEQLAACRTTSRRVAA